MDRPEESIPDSMGLAATPRREGGEEEQEKRKRMATPRRTGRGLVAPAVVTSAVSTVVGRRAGAAAAECHLGGGVG